jgi:hypothetical protein
VAAADVNRDGKIDLVVLSSESKKISILLGNGDGTFQSATQFPTGSDSPPQSLVLGDFNRDGNPDVAVTDLGTVSILLGNGDGTFQTPLKASAGSGPQYIVTGDFNHDDKLDLAVTSNGGSTVSILLGNGDGTFQTPIPYAAGPGPARLITADLNGDGNLDLAVISRAAFSVSILLGKSDGTFQPPVAYTVGSSNSLLFALAAGDLDGDGKLDLEISDETGSVEVLFGNGDGTFKPQVVYGTAPVGAIVAGDFNNDGRLDLAVASRSVSGGAVLLQIPSVSLSTTRLSFGKVNVGSTSNPKNVVLTNSGSASLAISSINIRGANSSDFSGTDNCGSSLAAGASCTITVTFTPQATGTRAATVGIFDNAPNSPQAVTLSGTGIGAMAMVSPTSLNFGNQTVGVKSAPRNVTLTNTGNIPLTITSIAITGTNTGSFAETNNCGSSLAARANCTIAVTFTPQAIGIRTAAVSITDNAPHSPQRVSLTGVGVRPAVTFSPTSLTFPTQVVFTTSTAKVVTLKNTGLGVLTVKSIAVTGPFSQTHTCGMTVNPGASCTISVTFKPTTIGTLTGSVSVTDNAPGSPQKVTLKGTGTYIQLAPTSVNFGNQPVGTKSLPKRITLTNKGSVAVSISGISITGTNASDFAQTHTCGTSVAAGASCFIRVTFKPSAKGKRAAAVSVNDDGGGSPQKVTLTGNGT